MVDQPDGPVLDADVSCFVLLCCAVLCWMMLCWAVLCWLAAVGDSPGRQWSREAASLPMTTDELPKFLCQQGEAGHRPGNRLLHAFDLYAVCKA